VKYKLVPAIGTINVRGPTGAKIIVDDAEKGRAPNSFSVPAGTHTVVLILDGKKVATEFVDVPSNDEVTIEGKAVAESKQKKEEVVEPEDGDPDTTSAGVSTTVVVAPAPARGPYISLAVAMDIGFRNFEYDKPLTDNLSPEKEGGQVLVGPVAEIWPGTLAGVRWLRGLSVLLRFGYGVNSQAVKQKVSMTTTSAKTFWRAFEVSVRHRWTIKQAMTIEVGGGYVRDQYQFEGMVQDIDLVPDADYQNVRFGLRASALLGSIEPYLTVENRLVLSGGTIEKRFGDASASGARVAAGAEAKFGAVNVRIEGALNYYSWTFKSNDTGDKWRASGGTDSIKFITAAVGYAY
jgi:hypothetical protein